MNPTATTAGRDDVQRTAGTLADRLPEPIRPLASLAYNLWWTWREGGADLFAAIDPARWERSGHNPVRLLREVSAASLGNVAGDVGFVARLDRVTADLQAELVRSPRPGPIAADRPFAFLCAEFGVHSSLPIYSGGLGVLAGDVLKQASDEALPMVGVGLLYRTGYFHQRLDTSGFPA